MKWQRGNSELDPRNCNNHTDHHSPVAFFLPHASLLTMRWHANCVLKIHPTKFRSSYIQPFLYHCQLYMITTKQTYISWVQHNPWCGHIAYCVSAWCLHGYIINVNCGASGWWTVRMLNSKVVFNTVEIVIQLKIASYILCRSVKAQSITPRVRVWLHKSYLVFTNLLMCTGLCYEMCLATHGLC